MMLLASTLLGPAIAARVSPGGDMNGWTLIATQVIVIAAPSVLLAILLSKSPRKVLRLKAPRTAGFSGSGWRCRSRCIR